MHSSQHHAATIICILSLGEYAGQEHFAGILDYCRKRTNWGLRLVDPEDLDEKSARRLLRSRPGGIIITLPGIPAAMRVLLASDLPIVIANIGGFRLPSGNRRISLVWTDNADIGEKGARFLLSLSDFRSYAFADVKGGHFWSKERGRAFCETLRKNGKDCECHAPNERTDDWLAALPKPAAVMAANDIRAIEIIESCARRGIDVPRQVAVLGVDNEPILRNRFHPQISSIRVNFFGMGFREAEELDRLLSKPHVHGRPEILIPADDVIPRLSTRTDARAEDITKRIKDYISANAENRISVSEIVRSVGCSRRLAEIRFRQLTGTSIRQAIENFRLARALELVKTTSVPRNVIARRCGFPSVIALTRALTRRIPCKLGQMPLRIKKKNSEVSEFAE